ncbi:hypothetical protein [Clostridium lacusfryxellense]|uniref:hypothetical protein n=1 Tax=Clostridium lacusfryxellense TaxID=205328 RepID=UPI001C0BB56E|nr:hypothetical protein [Clostridium lacusfryxellense]MBU3113988.1 hypothetical protein [Clostridium lacusfryxellense]
MNKLNGKRRRKYILNKTLDPLKKSDETNINREKEFSLFNFMYVLVWGSLLFILISAAPYSVKTISLFLIILIILLMASGFGSHIIIEEDRIIRKGIFCLSFRGKRNVYFNEIYDMSVRYKIVLGKYKIYTEPIYIFKNKENRKICIIDADNLPFKLMSEMDMVLLSILRQNKEYNKGNM